MFADSVCSLWTFLLKRQYVKINAQLEISHISPLSQPHKRRLPGFSVKREWPLKPLQIRSVGNSSDTKSAWHMQVLLLFLFCGTLWFALWHWSVLSEWFLFAAAGWTWWLLFFAAGSVCTCTSMACTTLEEGVTMRRVCVQATVGAKL